MRAIKGRRESKTAKKRKRTEGERKRELTPIRRLIKPSGKHQFVLGVESYSSHLQFLCQVENATGWGTESKSLQMKDHRLRHLDDGHVVI